MLKGTDSFELKLINIQVPVLQQARGGAGYRATAMMAEENINDDEDGGYSNPYIYKPKVVGTKGK